MSDTELKVISSRHPVEFQTQVNHLLDQGNWRIVASEMIVADNYFNALLVRSDTKPCAECEKYKSMLAKVVKTYDSDNTMTAHKTDDVIAEARQLLQASEGKT